MLKPELPIRTERLLLRRYTEHDLDDVHEAHFVQNEVVKGEWTDELVYAMLADEWSARP